MLCRMRVPSIHLVWYVASQFYQMYSVFVENMTQTMKPDKQISDKVMADILDEESGFRLDVRMALHMCGCRKC